MSGGHRGGSPRRESAEGAAETPCAPGDPMRRWCGAKTRAGGACRGAAMANRRCRMHGGATPAGVAHPGFKHGRYSKVLPVRLAAAYEAARTDDDLLSLRDEAALLQGRIGDLVSRVDSGDALRLWSEANAAVAAFEDAQAARDAPAMAAAWGRLRNAVQSAGRDWQTWAEIGATVERYRRVAESERKRLVEMQAMVSADEAMAFAAALVAVVRQHVTDPGELAAIQRGMRAAFEARRGRPDEGGEGSESSPPGKA